MRVLLSAATLIGAVTLGSSVASAQSFRATCPDVSREGPFIRATCLNTAGFPVRTAIDVRQCGGGDVANANGRLVCAGYGGGFRRPPPPPMDDDEDDYRPRRRYPPPY